MKRILVTGANGFVGTHLVNELKRENMVVGVAHNGVLGEWQREALDGVVTVNLDIRNMSDIKRVLARYQIQEVYHLAALAIVKTAHTDPLNTFDVNIMGSASVLEAARQTDVQKTVIMCTDKVFGSGRNLDEFVPFDKHPEPYAASKVCQAVIVGSYIYTYEMDVAMLHSCNIYGYDPYNDRIVPNVVKKCLRGESPLIFTNDPSVREYIYVKDVVNALMVLMARESTSGSYNASTGAVYSQDDMVRKILVLFPDISPVLVEHPIPKQLHEQSLKSNKWRWTPWWSLDQGLAETIEQFKKYSKDWM